jgi:hypothetical protein
MKKVFQTIVGNGSESHERGNCMQAAIASLFELELEDVPNFIILETGKGEANLSMWQFIMDKTGIFATVFGTFDTPIEKYKEICKFDGGIGGYFYASVKSQTFEGTSHAIIVDSNMNVVHDPNPNGKCLGMELDNSNLNYIITFGDWYIDLDGNLVKS